MVLTKHKKLTNVYISRVDRLYLETMEEVLSQNKNKIIVDKDIENLVPFLNQNNLKLK